MRGSVNASIADTIVVLVEELEATLITDPSNTLTCDNPAIEVIAGSNFPSGIDFSWSSIDADGDFESNQTTATIDAAGNYLLIADWNEGACFDSLQFTIDLDTTTYQSALIPSSNVINCTIDSVTLLLANDNADAEFNWQPPNAANFTWTNEPFELLTSTAGIWSVTTSQSREWVRIHNRSHHFRGFHLPGSRGGLRRHPNLFSTDKLDLRH